MRSQEFIKHQSTRIPAGTKKKTTVARQVADSEEQLDELSFLGSQCTKDCSGHRAGYEWSARKGNVPAASHSPSFNKGAALRADGR